MDVGVAVFAGAYGLAPPACVHVESWGGRHAWLTGLIIKAHRDVRGTYGALGVHAELRLDHGIVVGHKAVGATA